MYFQTRILFVSFVATVILAIFIIPILKKSEDSFCGLLIMFMMCLCSCSTNNQKNTSGKIDCYSIKVTDGGSTAFNRTYSASTSKVYEYKSESGDSIYINTRMYGTDYQGNTLDYKIFVYSDRYTSDYVEYSYYC